MRTEIPVLSFLVLPLLLLPLHTQWRTRNIATLTIILNLFFTNLIRGVNTIVWSGSVVPKLLVWCDITTKFSIGAQVAIPAASFCITKHLENIASLRQTIETTKDRRRRKIFEICLCGVLPCVIMALHYVVQGHRFDIAEDFGCIANIYISWPAIVVLYVPPLVLALGSLVYATLAFYWFMKRRNQFAEHLRSSNSGLTSSRYFRLMAMAVTEIVIETGLAGYLFSLQFQAIYLRDWDNWADVHSNFSRIAQFPTVLLPDYYWNRLVLNYYIGPICALDFFIFFGLGQEAMKEYGHMITWLRIHVLREKIKHSESVLPTWSAPQRMARVHLDDLDMVSMDEKWDTGAEDLDGSSSMQDSRPSSQHTETDSQAPPRPKSAPPIRPASSNLDGPRAFSLDIPRR
ncbi:hypothetical protein FRB94_005008 [Tulasnella sp. JGI-2019a]|nr:hypothetical protein FRB94_005008 [Tulasnella sp. JGI-2019a]